MRADLTRQYVKQLFLLNGRHPKRKPTDEKVFCCFHLQHLVERQRPKFMPICSNLDKAAFIFVHFRNVAGAISSNAHSMIIQFWQKIHRKLPSIYVDFAHKNP